MTVGRLALWLFAGFILGWMLQVIAYKVQAAQVVGYAERLAKANVPG